MISGYARYRIHTTIGLLLFCSFALAQSENDSSAYNHGGGAAQHRLKAFFHTFDASEYNTTRYGLETSVPIFNFGPIAISSNFNVALMEYGPSNNNELQKSLIDINETLEMKSPRFWGLLTVGTVSDKVFDSYANTSIGGFSVYDVLHQKKHSLYIGAFYSSTFLIPDLPDVPYPLIVYQYKSPSFIFMGPFPLIINWIIDGSLTFSYAFELDSQETFLRYKLGPKLNVDIAANFIQKAIYISDRENKDIIRWYEQGQAGIRISYKQNAKLEFNGFVGYTFSGQYYDAKSSFYEKMNKTTIDQRPFLNLEVQYVW